MPYGRFDLAKRKENSRVLTELSFPSLNIDLSLFFSLVNTQLRIGKLYINGWPAKQEKANQKGAVYHQVWQWSRFHDQLFKRKGTFLYFFLHLRKRLYNSTLSAYTEELEALWPLFFPIFKNSVQGKNRLKVSVQSMAFPIFVHLHSTEASFQSDAVVCGRINIVHQMLCN